MIYADSSADNGINAGSRDEGNSSMYIPRFKLEAELADLDADFQKRNADTTAVIDEYKKVHGNAKVHFYLHDIKYVPAKHRRITGPFTNTGRLHQLSPIIDAKKFLNVFVSLIKYRSSYTSGLTPVKTSAIAADGNDAVNISYEWTGLGYRLLTHEVGHWLGLWHTWDDSQAGEGIDDIPLQKTSTDIPCVRCPPAVRDQLRSGTGFHSSNYNNFMDYSGCRNMFSVKQALHIRYVILHYRTDLWNSK